MMFSTPRRNPYNPPPLFTSTHTTERPSKSVKFTVNSKKVTLHLEVPGVNPHQAEVRLEGSDGERMLVVEEVTTSATTNTRTAKSVRLPAAAGKPITKARFKHGMLTVSFERVLIPETIDLEVEVYQ